MNQLDRINRAKVQLQLRNPFFSFLSFHLKFEENKSIAGDKVALNDDGVVYFNPDYVATLSEEKIIGVICHEILHLSLLHLLRRNNRDKKKWDFACDLTVNTILKQNNFQLPDSSVIPEDNYSYVDENNYIIDCQKKFVEKIYDEVKIKEDTKQKKNGNSDKGGNNPNDSNAAGNNKNNCSNAENDNDDASNSSNSSNESSPNEKLNPGQFDTHIENGNQSRQDKNEKESDWINKTASAYASSKLAGKMPLGLERLFDMLGNSKIDWRTLLFDYIQKMIPADYTWQKRNKRGVSRNIHLPDIVKEKMTVCLAVDASGSIDEKELNDFLTEIMGIYKAYEDTISMRVLSHDVDVHTDIEISPEDSLNNIKIEGGGGTSHKKVVKYINENVEDCEIVIFLTDGYSDIPSIDFDGQEFKSLFVISSNGDISPVKKLNYVKIEEHKNE